MKTLNIFLSEKLKLDKNLNVFDIDIDDMVNNILGPWLVDKDTLWGQNSKHRRFEFLKDFDNKIISLINCFEGSLEKLAKKANMTPQQFEHYVTNNNDELYKKCEQFYSDMYNDLTF